MCEKLYEDKIETRNIYIKKVIFFILFFVPVFFTHSSVSAFMYSKLVGLAFMLAISYGIYVASLTKFSEKGLVFSFPIFDLFFFSSLIWAFLSWFWSSSRVLTYFHIRYFFLFGAFFILLRYYYSEDKGIFRKKIFFIIIYTGAFVSLYALIFQIILSRSLFKSAGFNLVGFMGNPNFYADFMVTPIMFTFSYVLLGNLRSLSRLFYTFLLIVEIFTLLKTNTLGVLLPFSVVIFLLFIFYIFSRFRRYRTYTIIAIILLLILGIYLATPHINKFLKDPNIIRRVVLYRLSLEMMRDRPFGYGLGTFRYIFPRYQADFYRNEEFLKLYGARGSARHAHNEYLEFGAELGWPGFILLIILFGSLFLKGFIYFLKKGIMGTFSFDYIFFVGSFLSYSIILFHAGVSFPFHLPANFLYFLVSVAYLSYFLTRNTQIASWAIPMEKFAFTVFNYIVFIILLYFTFISINNYIGLEYLSETNLVNIHFEEIKQKTGASDKTIVLNMRDALLKAKRLFPDYPDFEQDFLLATIYISLKQPDKAMTVLKELLTYSDVPAPNALLAVLYKIKGDYKNAIKYYLKALERSKINPSTDVSDWALELGTCYFNVGNKKEALYWTKKALKLNPFTLDKKIRIWYNLGVIYYYLGDKAESEKFLKLVVDKKLSREVKGDKSLENLIKEAKVLIEKLEK